MQVIENTITKVRNKNLPVTPDEAETQAEDEPGEVSRPHMKYRAQEVKTCPWSNFTIYSETRDIGKREENWVSIQNKGQDRW